MWLLWGERHWLGILTKGSSQPRSRTPDLSRISRLVNLSRVKPLQVGIQERFPRISWIGLPFCCYFIQKIPSLKFPDESTPVICQWHLSLVILLLFFIPFTCMKFLQGHIWIHHTMRGSVDLSDQILHWSRRGWVGSTSFSQIHR